MTVICAWIGVKLPWFNSVFDANLISHKLWQIQIFWTTQSLKSNLSEKSGVYFYTVQEIFTRNDHYSPFFCSGDMEILNSSFSIDNLIKNHFFDWRLGARIIFSSDLLAWKLHAKSTSTEFDDVTEITFAWFENADSN